MFRRAFRCALTLLVLPCVFLFSGCGGDGLPQATPAAFSQSSQAGGSASFAVRWPGLGAPFLPSTHSRLSRHIIPAACNSILVTITRSGQPILSQLIVRPTASVTLSGLPVGALTVTALAYPTLAGTGVVQASATVPLTITAGAATPLTLTLADAVASLVVTSMTQNLPVGGTLALVATAYNSAGSVVMTGSSIHWASATTAVATVSASGVVTGIAAGSAVITATDSESSVSGSFTVGPVASSPYGGVPQAIPGTVQAENYDYGGEGVAYHDTDPANDGGQYRNDGVDIGSCSDTGGGYAINYIAAGEWQKYTVNVSSAGSYTVSFRVASPYSTTALHLENSAGTNLTGSIAVPATGNFTTWQSVTATVTLPAGIQTLKLVEETNGFNINYFAFS